MKAWMTFVLATLMMGCGSITEPIEDLGLNTEYTCEAELADVGHVLYRLEIDSKGVRVAYAWLHIKDSLILLVGSSWYGGADDAGARWGAVRLLTPLAHLFVWQAQMNPGGKSARLTRMATSEHWNVLCSAAPWP